MKIAILGWGSLLWDKRSEFDEHHEEWQFDGPSLKIEFSRVSQTRNDALTLVLDTKNGTLCQVAYAFSKRKHPDDAICDLRSREGTILKYVGFCFVKNSRKQAQEKEVIDTIYDWALTKKIDVVIWTDLQSNFKQKSRDKKSFTVENAIDHVRSLDSCGQAKAAEYVKLSPKFVKTPLRYALESKQWFKDSYSLSTNCTI